jgi:hypothetical protein
VTYCGLSSDLEEPSSLGSGKRVSSFLIALAENPSASQTISKRSLPLISTPTLIANSQQSFA